MAGKKAVTPPKSSVSAKAGEEKELVKKAASAKGKKIPATAGKGGKEASLSKTVEKSRIDQKVNPYRSNRLQRKNQRMRRNRKLKQRIVLFLKLLLEIFHQ